jgi:hypothetical protein
MQPFAQLHRACCLQIFHEMHSISLCVPARTDSHYEPFMHQFTGLLIALLGRTEDTVAYSTALADRIVPAVHKRIGKLMYKQHLVLDIYNATRFAGTCRLTMDTASATHTD